MRLRAKQAMLERGGIENIAPLLGPGRAATHI